jgi:tetratricopeptide (TPR) repeat protein
MKQSEKILLKDSKGNVVEVSRDEYKNLLFKEVEANKNDAEQLFYIGHAFLNDGFFEEAMTVFKLATDIDPKNMMYDNAIGVCYLQMAQYEKAKEFFMKHIERFPNSALGYLNSAKACDYLNQTEEVEKYLKKSIELNPNLYNSLLYWLLYCKDLNKMESGIEFLLDVAERGKGYWGPYLILALEFEERGNKTLALEYADKALMNNIDNGCAFADLATLYARLGKIDKTIEILEKKSISEKLSFKEVWNLAIAYYETGNIERARKQIEILENMVDDDESKALVKELRDFWEHGDT